MIQINAFVDYRLLYTQLLGDIAVDTPMNARDYPIGTRLVWIWAKTAAKQTWHMLTPPQEQKSGKPKPSRGISLSIRAQTRHLQDSAVAAGTEEHRLTFDRSIILQNWNFRVHLLWLPADTSVFTLGHIVHYHHIRLQNITGWLGRRLSLRSVP